ncbi:hypothetical protein J4P02_11280 [Pseudomonas sp. NFXW11]|uniref:hypothetical protein n=1 Tax=Pseudomonas sp. NFXW11 TaxID=2819531 RepID=UPI003CF15DA6
MPRNAELRLFAVPLCAALVYALIKGLVNGWAASQLFSGFLFGSVIAMLLGIPLLLWGDRRCPGAPWRHLGSSLLQALVAGLLLGPSPRHLLLALLGGLALGALSSLVLRGIERLPAPPDHGQSRGWGRLLAVPLSGALTLGAVAVALYPKGSESLPVLLMGGMVGAWIGMLVGWPMLWLVERLFATRWRYVLGGGLSGLLIWLLSGAPGLYIHSLKGASGLDYWIPLLNRGVFPFLLLGLLGGLLFSLFNEIRRRPRLANHH